MQWEWNDGIGSRSRQPACVVVLPNGECHRFTGVTIPNVAEVVGEKFEKNGKWSNSTYTVLSPDRSAIVSWRQSWEEGLHWPQAYWRDAIMWVKQQAPLARDGAIEALIRAEWKQAAAKFDAAADAEARMGAAQADRAVVIVTKLPQVVEWLRRNGIEGRVLEAATPDQVRYQALYVAGQISMAMAAAALEVLVVETPKGSKPIKEMSADEMEASGAVIVRYIIQKVTR